MDARKTGDADLQIRVAEIGVQIRNMNDRQNKLETEFDAHAKEIAKVVSKLDNKIDDRFSELQGFVRSEQRQLEQSLTTQISTMREHFRTFEQTMRSFISKWGAIAGVAIGALVVFGDKIASLIFG